MDGYRITGYVLLLAFVLFCVRETFKALKRPRTEADDYEPKRPPGDMRNFDDYNDRVYNNPDSWRSGD